jgi:hypothetical protein
MKISGIFLLALIHFGVSTCTQKFDVSECKNFHEIRDFDGNYLKSVCYVDKFKNYTEASNFCESKGMQLIETENSSSLLGSVELLDIIWSKPENNPWLWVRFANSECVKLFKEACASYKIRKTKCDESNHFFCEYTRNCKEEESDNEPEKINMN